MGNLYRDAHAELNGQQLILPVMVENDLLKRQSVYKIHHEVRAVFVLAHVEHTDHIGVADQRRQPRLFEEHAAKARVVEIFLVQSLDRVEALEPEASMWESAVATTEWLAGLRRDLPKLPTVDPASDGSTGVIRAVAASWHVAMLRLDRPMAENALGCIPRVASNPEHVAVALARPRLRRPM